MNLRKKIINSFQSSLNLKMCLFVSISVLLLGCTATKQEKLELPDSDIDFFNLSYKSQCTVMTSWFNYAAHEAGLTKDILTTNDDIRKALIVGFQGRNFKPFYGAPLFDLSNSDLDAFCVTKQVPKAGLSGNHRNDRSSVPFCLLS